MTDDTQAQIKIVSKIVNAGNSRKVITIPASDLPKIKDLTGEPVLITLTPII